ncbi:polyprenol phosphomannose-dependent alpha 1,6 mannosyltransferase MptB [Kitasatospora sp. MBT63]|uniref:polyprenol phosphomannose-dependent alpha 1,6 mannosyltransferase MptB n=1 Tax=Kitasatospora sp. MBT63 TaxID=1444768 RepID=UPI00069056D0|nr:polyprenol phosphomannose-dependent alpha 1,6 mannosyltransferase MptB [Kitasatospora sp. MBT63]
MPIRGVATDPYWCRTLGFAGTAALAVGGLAAGALPTGVSYGPLHGHPRLGLLVVYFGLVLLIAGWLRLGQVVRGPHAPGPRSLMLTLALWAAPLVAGPPLFSRDVYSYLAQGAMVDGGLDVYTHGPADLGGPLAEQVPAVWQFTPAPYGPVFLSLSGAVAGASGRHVYFGVLGLRLVALLGVALLVALVPRLARRCGVDPGVALWLGVLNPLVLLHLVAGAHNDAVMLGLLVAGLVLALARRPLWAAGLVCLAALVKAPAALGLLPVAALWSQRLKGRARLLRAGSAVAAAALGTAAAATAATGTGYGWIHALGTPVSAGNWSLTSALGRATRGLAVLLGAGPAEGATALWRWLGLAAAAAVLLYLWARRPVASPVHLLGLSLTALVVLGPALRPWYALWGVVLLAAAATHGRIRRWAAPASGVLALAVLPSGFAPDIPELAAAVTGGLLAVAALYGLRLLPGDRPLVIEAQERALW